METGDGVVKLGMEGAKGPEVQKGRALALSVSSISVLFKAWGIR